MEQNKHRLVVNTIALYLRFLLSLGVYFYTSRIILNALGVSDFGIYNVVGGCVGIIALFTGTLTAASQRFLAFELGKKESSHLIEIFSIIKTAHTFLSVVVLILGETLGLWFLNTHIHLDVSRLNAANWVYQASLLSVLFSIISVPYNAAIVAHERLDIFAYIGMGEVCLKLVAALMIFYSPFDRLKTYAILIMLITLLIRCCYTLYCKKKFVECSAKFLWNSVLFKQYASFFGWNSVGVIAGTFSTQGVSIVLNLFGGVIVNATQGIANQVQNAVSGFVENFMTALTPQITKSYAYNDHVYMTNLIFQGARFSFFLIIFLAFPVLIETPLFLKFWLKIVPLYSVVFVRLSIILSITQALSHTLIRAMLATGDIKIYQIVIGGLQLLICPLAYIFLYIGFPVYSALLITIIISIISLFARLFLLHHMIGLSVIDYCCNVLINVIKVGLISIVFPLIIHFNMSNDYLRVASVTFCSFISVGGAVYIWGLSKQEKIWLLKTIEKFKKRVFS